MKKIIKITAVYNLLLISTLLVFGVSSNLNYRNILFSLSLVPVIIYFAINIFHKLPFNLLNQYKTGKMNHFLNLYSFIFVNLLFVSLILNLHAFSEILFVIFFVPLELYFIFLTIWNLNHKVLSKNNKKIYTLEENIFDFKSEDVVVLERYEGVKEIDKRKFFKLLAGAGLGVFVAMMLNPQKAGAAFFGSVPGPGTVGIKDSGGSLIDPAIKSPTDGYGIMNVDTASYPYYYGFVNKDGAWYITKEASDGSFSYAKGNSGYTWSTRAAQSYASFDSTF